jgi:hypothetical protein
LVVEPEVVSVTAELQVSALASGAAEPDVVFAVVVSVADVAEPQACVDTPVLFGVSVPASAIVVGVDSSARPNVLAFPNVGYCASSSSSVEAVGKESVHSPTGARTNHGVRSTVSSLGPHQNRSLERGCNKPIPGHNNVTGTSPPTKDATTTHSRKTDQPLYQEQPKIFDLTKAINRVISCRQVDRSTEWQS